MTEKEVLEMSVGVPMVIRSEKYSQEVWKEFERNLKSDDLKELVKAAEFEGLTIRQAMFLAHRCVELEDRGADDAPALARALLSHSAYVKWLAPILNDSTLMSVWKEIVRTDGVPREVLEGIYQRTRRRYDLMIEEHCVFQSMSEVWEIWYGLASSAMLPGEIQDRLLGMNIWEVRKRLTFSPTMSGPRLLKLIKIFRDTWDAACTLEIVERIGGHPNATDAVKKIARTIGQYYQWWQEAGQAQEITLKRMLELAQSCAGIDDCPRRALELAERLIARPELTPAVLDILVDSLYSYIWYLVARCELTSTETLKKILPKVFEVKLCSEIESQFDGILVEILRHPNCTEEVVDVLLESSEKQFGWWQACRYAIYCRHTTSRQLRRIMEMNWNTQTWHVLAPEVMMSPEAEWDLVKRCYENRGDRRICDGVDAIEQAYDDRSVNAAINWEERRQQRLSYELNSVETHAKK